MSGILDVCSSLSLGDGTIKADFIGRGNIWINNYYDGTALSLARVVLSQALFKTAPGQLSVTAYDEDLTGLFAPFASLSAGESRVLNFINDQRQLTEELSHLRQEIQAVQNVIQGRTKSLLEFRSMLNRPVEGYRLIVLLLDLGTAGRDVLSQLQQLLRSGPDCGISFLIVSTTVISYQTGEGREVTLSPDTIAPHTTILDPGAGSVSVGENRPVRYKEPSAEYIIRQCEIFTENLRNAKLPTVHFEELHDLNHIWKESSVDGLTFCVGQNGVNHMEITIGDEVNQRHNAVITGAVGQGKSNLISVIVHSLCVRYSPDELQLYLLDFKEGVSFKAFANIGCEDFLPHARTLGLESDVSFGQAVLEALYEEYLRRMKMLKDANAKSIRELRMQQPQLKMPRIVAVIDEFQMMFGDDHQTAQRMADLLEKSVRLFRAAGIHFILASQTLGGGMKLVTNKDSIFSQVPVRIALKNSKREATAVLAMDNPAAVYLRPREAVVNLDYGELSQNRKTVIAFADEKLLKPLRRKMWEKVRTTATAPYVFESERRMTVSTALTQILQRRRTGQVPAAFLGDRISVEGSRLLIPMPEEPGRNVLILGTPDEDCQQAAGMLQSAAISLALQHPQQDARFLFCDFNQQVPYERSNPRFSSLMESLGYFVEDIPAADFADTVKELLQQPAKTESIYIFGLNMDRWECPAPAFGQPTVLRDLVDTGSSKGLHFFGWWVKHSKYSKHMAGMGNTDGFNTKIFLRTDERTVQTMTSPFVRWVSHTNRGLAADEVEFTDPITFIPYAPVKREDQEAFRRRSRE